MEEAPLEVEAITTKEYGGKFGFFFVNYARSCFAESLSLGDNLKSSIFRDVGKKERGLIEA